VGLLIDLLQVCGLSGLAQVDLGTRTHSHQTDEALGKMAGQIVNALLSRAERGRHGRRIEPGGLLTQFSHDGSGFVPTSTPVAVDQRPPMATVAEYRGLRADVTG
jgi:glucosyl-3-phosphoglycerate synthase